MKLLKGINIKILWKIFNIMKSMQIEQYKLWRLLTKLICSCVINILNPFVMGNMLLIEYFLTLLENIEEMFPPY